MRPYPAFGKPYSETQAKHDDECIGPLDARQAMMFSTLQLSLWHMREKSAKRKRSSTIWVNSFQKIQARGSASYQPFVRSFPLVVAMPQKLLTTSEPRRLMTSECRRLVCIPGPRFILFLFEVKGILLRIKGMKVLPSSRKSSTILGS
jgi:hypothetical protein